MTLTSSSSIGLPKSSSTADFTLRESSFGLLNRDSLHGVDLILMIASYSIATGPLVAHSARGRGLGAPMHLSEREPTR